SPSSPSTPSTPPSPPHSSPTPCTPHLSRDSHHFLFQPTPPPELYTLSLHDALPISRRPEGVAHQTWDRQHPVQQLGQQDAVEGRSEEHTSELQSRENLVCRLLLEKKKKKDHNPGKVQIRADEASISTARRTD